MTPEIAKIAAASSATAAATLDLIETVCAGKIAKFSAVGSGETVEALADALRLVLLATSDTSNSSCNDQLLGAVVKYLNEQGNECES